MKRWHLITLISLCFTAIMVVLATLFPGFPLLLFIALPPLFCWGAQEERADETKPSTSIGPRYCPQCGKTLLEPQERYCPRCGAPIPSFEG